MMLTSSISDTTKLRVETYSNNWLKKIGVTFVIELANPSKDEEHYAPLSANSIWLSVEDAKNLIYSLQDTLEEFYK